MKHVYKFVKTHMDVVELGAEGWVFVAHIQEVGQKAPSGNYTDGRYLLEYIEKYDQEI